MSLIDIAKDIFQILEENQELKKELRAAYLAHGMFCCYSPSIAEDTKNSRYTCVSCGRNSNKELYEILNRLES